MNYPIIAISTSKENSAIGIIRISFGDLKLDYKYFFIKIFKKVIKPRYATYVNFYYNNLILDNGIVIFFNKPNSYTGEDVLEFHGHGNYLNLKYILKIFLLIFKNFKIRLAKKGEFTKRAFINKKLNLIEVNNILNLINSNNNISLKNIHYNFKFNLYLRLKNIYYIILNIKNTLLYKEINNENLFKIKLNYKLNYIFKKIFEIYKNINYTNFNKNSIIFIGLSNTGKSTIINKIINENSLIVNSKPGTTRDLVSREIFINNSFVNLFDTAGFRRTKNKIEKLGIKLAFKQIKKSKIVIYIYNKKIIKKFFFNKIFKSIRKKNILFIFNKIDLYDNLINLEIFVKNNKKFIIVKLSAKYNLGINLLYIELSRLLLITNKLFYKNNFILKVIRKIYNYLYKIIFFLKRNNINYLLNNFVFLTSYMYKILNFNKKKEINNLFKKFCIGK